MTRNSSNLAYNISDAATYENELSPREDTLPPSVERFLRPSEGAETLPRQDESMPEKVLDVENIKSIDIAGDINSFSKIPAIHHAPAFKVLNRWEGTVERIENNSFKAVVKDLDDDKAASEEITVDFSDIAPDDHEFIKAGAVFYWHIGYIISESGTFMRGSTFRFRRLPAWSKRELEESKIRASQFRNKLFGP